ncbi:MAG: hypothetical protein XD74_0573 [Actinobacteria bacterium 66_15]|jgi:hypothetical protein|nr:MAG: hypothetical protein XD74_0573 [Actinobacteria bacterium 66_15]
MRLVWGTVESAGSPESGAQRLRVRLDGDSAGAAAVAYGSLTGVCRPGERVLCNTTAVDLGLGTGGEHFVVARAGTGVVLDDPSPGHIMKLRYTPLQRDVLSVEEPASGHHATMSEARDLGGLPVVCCGLHSQVPVVAAAVKERSPHARVVYVMTDESALPIALSRLVPRMRDAGLVDETVTCGQAFGGGLEAVNLYSGLLAARAVAAADVAIVAIGPGIPGTSTPYGHSGVAQGQAVNAAAALGGRPIAVLRLSFADPRPRHVPVSHQSLTALGSVALAPAVVPVPALDPAMAASVDDALGNASVWRLHERRDVDVRTMPDMRGVEVRTMGRAYEDDPAFFLAAAAAGVVGVHPDGGHLTP